jgi:hypothetical protein
MPLLLAFHHSSDLPSMFDLPPHPCAPERLRAKFKSDPQSVKAEWAALTGIRWRISREFGSDRKSRR